MATDVIITGLPRAGSSVVGALVDFLPDTVCLNAPEWHNGFADKHNHVMPICKWLIGDFYWQRKQLLSQTPVADYRNADASPLMDSASTLGTETKQVHFTRSGLTPDFTLAMRHTLLYTAILPQLVEFGHFKIIAVIRNPIDVILSWQKQAVSPLSMNNPVSIGWLWPEAHGIAKSTTDEVDRMTQVAELYYQRYFELQDKIDIVKYEDVAENPIIASHWFNFDKTPANASQVIPQKQARPTGSTDGIRAALSKYGIFSRQFYPNI